MALPLVHGPGVFFSPLQPRIDGSGAHLSLDVKATPCRAAVATNLAQKWGPSDLAEFGQYRLGNQTPQTKTAQKETRSEHEPTTGGGPGEPRQPHASIPPIPKPARKGAPPLRHSASANMQANNAPNTDAPALGTATSHSRDGAQQQQRNAPPPPPPRQQQQQQQGMPGPSGAQQQPAQSFQVGAEHGAHKQAAPAPGMLHPWCARNQPLLGCAHPWPQGVDVRELDNLLHHIHSNSIPDAAPEDAPSLQAPQEDSNLSGFGRLNHAKHGTDMDAPLSDRPERLPVWAAQQHPFDLSKPEQCKWAREFHQLVTGKTLPGYQHRRAVKKVYNATAMMKLEGWQVRAGEGGRASKGATRQVHRTDAHTSMPHPVRNRSSPS